VVRAELNYTLDGGTWKDRKWESTGVTLNSCSGVVQAEIPEKATVYYLNLVTEKDYVISSEHEEL